MPSFLGRFLGISRRTERLIMNILGLVNSTLDWSPIKWSNKLEQIWNLSLSQGTRIFDIIGEDTIKTVLSWIVITRIVIAHLYTFSYMINLYPILTSTQPNLLLPWLILSFFKNVVLEVIVIAVGLLLWYDKRFSLTIFFEFVLVKVVPLIIFSYVWYSNSCLFLEQCHMEKMRKLKRMRSDSNLIVGRLYIKLADSKYRTRSLTTLLSCESYETYDTHDTISRIIDDPTLTPAQKTMRILGLTDQDVADARTRIKEREIHKKLTELEDNSLTNTTKNMSRYFFDKYDFDTLKDLPKVKDERTKEREDEVTTDERKEDETTMDERKEDETTMDERKEDETTMDERKEDETTMDERKEDETTMDERKEDEIVMNARVGEQVAKYGCEEDETTVMEGKEDELTTSEATEDKVTTDIILSNPSTSSMNVLLEQPLDDRSICSEKTNPSVEQRSSSGMKRVAADCLERSCAKQMKLYPSDRAKDSNQSDSLSRKQSSSQSNLSFSRHARQSVEKSSSPVKLQALFNCNCIVDEYLYKGNAEEYCFTNGGTMATSTPNRSIDEAKMTRSAEKSDFDSSKSTIYHSCLDDTKDVDPSQNQKTETTTNNSLLLIRELLQNDLNILRDIKKDDQKLENGSLMLDDKPKQDILKISESESSVFRKLYVGQCNTSIGIQNLSDIVKDLSVARNVVTNLETLRTVESDESRNKLKNENEILKIMVPTTVIDDDVSSAQRSSLSSGKPKKTKKNVLKVNAPEYSFGDANIPRFVKDSMKVFDGCYEKDFANNSELQCMLQQLEKKKWSIFPGQPNQNMSIPSTFLKQNDQHYPSSASQDLGIVGLPITHFDTMERYEVSASTSSKETDEHLVSEIVSENVQSLDDDISVLSDIHKPGISGFTKDAHTQSDNDDHQDQPRTSNLGEKHRKTFLKRKCLKEQSRSVSPIANFDERKIESQNSVGKDHGKPPMRQKPTKLNDNQRKPAGLTKSVSDRSVCECKTCQKDSKYPISTESKLVKRGENKRCTAKCKVETFGTIPFSQVVRPSMFDSMVYRRKPPVYPKKAKNEPPAQPDASSVANTKKTSPFKELLEPSKRPADKQSSHGSKKFKWKKRMESLEEQEAREMKALKAYNEVTLLKDKKELEAKKKLLSGRNLATAPESLKNRGYPRKNNLERYKKNIPRNVETTYNDCFDKENLLTDATTETEPLPNLPFMDNKTQFAAPARFFDVPREKYSCSKLSNANKVADKVLNNFGKSHAEQVKQDAKKSKQTLGETDTRKQYTKYSKPKKSMDEENVSIVSMKRLEGAQKGRDLERTPAKEDVRSRLEISAESFKTNRLTELDSRDSQSRMTIAGSFVQSDHDKVTSTFVDGKDFGAQVGDLATLIKPTTTQDVASSWSSSVIEREDESYFQKRDDANTQTVQLEARTLKLENSEEKDETAQKTEDHEGEVERTFEAENVEKEVVPVSETEVQPKEVGAILEVTNHEEEVEPMLETEDQRNETESILKVEDQKQKFESTLVTKDHEKEVELVSETEGYQKHEIEGDKKEEIKESAVSDDSLAEYLPESIDDEKEILQTDRITDEITDEIRRYSSEVSQNESEISSRRIYTNLSDFIRNIDTNYVADGVILSNSNAPRENNTPVWDIVDEETIRKLHNMFSHRSVDSTFNLPGEIQTVDDILNNRQSESSIDDFIFQSGRYSTNLSMYEHTILATIRPLQTLEEEEDHAGSLYDLYITTMDQEGLPINFEVESMEDLEDEVEHPAANRLGLNDVVIQVTRFLRNLNFRGFNLENLSGVLEILPDPVDDDEDRIEFEIDEEDEEKDEEMEEWPIEDRRILKFIKEDCLRFIKEDIFTDMKFPIVVRLSDVIGDDLATSDEESEELDVVLEQAEPSKINLFSLMDDKYDEANDKIEETGTEEMDEGEETTSSKYFKTLQKIQGTMFTTAFPSRPIVSVSDYNAVESMLNEERITTCSEDAFLDEIVAKFMSNLKKYILKRSEPVQFRRQNLNQTYEILDKTDTEEEIKVEESIDSEEIEGSDNDEAVEQITTIEDIEEIDEKITTKQNKVDVTYQVTEEEILDTRIEEYGNVSWKEIDKDDQNIQLIEFESEANEKMQTSVREETFERDEDESLEKIKSNKIDGNEESDFEVDGEGNVELKEKLSLYTIFTFLLAISCFYFGYYYRKIFSFKQISTSTSTLKPFEIHATPTSTTAFFENSTLMKETKEEKYEETEQEENDSFERLVDLETIEISQFTKYDSELDLDSIVHRTLSDSLRTIHEDSLKEIENEVGESVSLRERILENTEFQEKAAEINSENLRVRSNSQIHSASRSTDTIESASIRKLDIRTSEPPFIVEPNKLKEDSLELRLAEEEIETFRYREDDDSDSSKSLSTPDDETKLLNEIQMNIYAKVVIEEKEEMLNAEELRTSSCEAKSKTSTSKIQKEDCEQSSKEEKEKEERSVVDETDAEGIIFSKQEVEKSKASTEQSESSSSPQIFETTDSFDSTYTRASETSRNATSAVDLNDSSMEEFVIASNESIISDKASGCS